MNIKVLVENTTSDNKLKNEHGLSLYIETKKHTLLFDTGASGKFAENAKKMGVDLSKVDTAFVSHGHYDHGGGLQDFLDLNQKANIYVQKDIFNKYYEISGSKEIRNIGLDKLVDYQQFISVKEDYKKIDKELEVFSGVKEREYFSKHNKKLFMKKGGKVEEDSFLHEQNLIINENGKSVLITGCAHNGIVNIINKFIELKGVEPDFVIGGFHLYNPEDDKAEKELIQKTAEKLNSKKSIYYTGHCTQPEAYKLLKSILKDKVYHLSTGMTIEI